MIKKIIHIGPPKTGTTFLQRHYFPGIPKLTFFFRNDYVPMQNADVGEAVLFSTEALTGRAWNEDWKRGKKNSHRYINSFKKTVSNLHKIYPEARIMIIFRKHGDWLISLYKQYILEGGTLSFTDFYHEEGVINDQDLDYYERVKFLKDLFVDVDVLSFEQFKKEGTNYYDRYFESLGFGKSQMMVENVVNASMSGSKLELLRKINKRYPHVPKVFRNFLMKNRMEPRRILRERMKFWKTSDTQEMKETKQKVNAKFEEDWKKVETYFFQ